jgi:hypothetical protein
MPSTSEKRTSATKNRGSISASIAAERQAGLREQANAARDQLASLESVLENSALDIPMRHNLSTELARLRAGMQRLQEMEESDWARGLTDEPPPMYDALSARRA